MPSSYGNRSNLSYMGFQALNVAVGNMTDLTTYVEGPFFGGTVYYGNPRLGYPICYKNKGKLYLEISYVLHTDFYERRQYILGLASVAHTLSSTIGTTPESWVYNDRLNKIITNGVESAPPSGFSLPADPYSCNRLAIAIDYDAGKIWFGSAHNTTAVWYGGDPVAGTTPLFTFTPGTAIGPAVAVVHTVTGNSQYQLEFSTTALYCRADPPTGYAYWDVFEEQQEVLADGPQAYWLAQLGPQPAANASSESELLENPKYYAQVGLDIYPGSPSVNRSGNSSRVVRYPYFPGDVFGSLYRPFPSNVLKGYYSPYNDNFMGFPVSLSSGASFTFLVRIEVTGAGRIGGGSNVWKEGSYLLCNTLSPEEFVAPATLDSDIWMGISLRDRRLKFGVGAYEVTSAADLANGFYMIGAELDFPNSTLRLWVNGSLSSSTTGYTNPSKTADWFGCGTTWPVATGGIFPGYFREIAVFDKVLNSTRHLAYYENSLKGLLPPPITQIVERVGLTTPNFMR